MKTLQEQAFSSVFWSAIERFSVQGGQIIIEIIIARILLPSDYGLVAMLSVFLAIAQTFIDSGFSNALIQKENKTDIDYSTILYFNVFIGVLAYLLLFFFSPMIASFYNETRLELIAKVIGLGLIINSFAIVQRTKLIVALNFKKQALISFLSILGSGTCSIYLAFSGFGVWTLVFQTLMNNLFNTLLLWITSKWKPLLVFSKKSFLSMFSYGSRLLFASLLQTIYLNLYTLVIGKKFASQDLGYYNRAYTLAQVPSYKLTEIMTNAMFPIQCQIQNEDDKLRSSFIQYLRMACFIIFPLTLLLCALAEPTIKLVLTDKWLPMVPLLQILCIAYMWTPVMTINHNILKVKGRMDYFLKAEILKKVTAVCILYLTLSYGLTILCAGLILYSFADIFIISRYSCRLIHVTLWIQFKEIAPILILSIIVGMITFILQHIIASDLLKILVGGISGVVLYVILSRMFKINEINILLLKVKEILK